MSRPLHLFIFADALGWELVRHYGILQSVAPYQNKCETLFGYSATCDPEHKGSAASWRYNFKPARLDQRLEDICAVTCAAAADNNELPLAGARH